VAPSRQSPISISKRDREKLDEQKSRYEESIGQKTDWGNFLRTMALFGLAVAGTYLLAKATQRTPQTVDVMSSGCRYKFIMSVPEGCSRAIYTTCPSCGAELVVDLG
jgi:hypothetical protein